MMPNNTVTLSDGSQAGTGWLPPLPDLRDYSNDHPDVAAMAKQLKIGDNKAPKGFPFPASIDLRPGFSPIENQGQLGSCSANATMGVIEYMENRAYKQYTDGSRLFLYKTTRNLMGVTGDTGAWLRNAMGALALCGVPPEKYWSYNIATFDNEPPAFAYSLADHFEALKYFCHDPFTATVLPASVLASVKLYLAAGIPSVFGFFGFSSFNQTSAAGCIPYPCPGETVQWGHAVVAAGYDDKKKITNTKCNKTTTGALLIRNSWGTAWGEGGYGWLPYDYVLNKLAVDFWSLCSMGYVNTRQFGLQT